MCKPHVLISFKARCVGLYYTFFCSVQLNDTAGLRKQPRMLKFLCHSAFSNYVKNKVQPNIFHNIGHY
jgi:hypothetical protein